MKRLRCISCSSKSSSSSRELRRSRLRYRWDWWGVSVQPSDLNHYIPVALNFFHILCSILHDTSLMTSADNVNNKRPYFADSCNNKDQRMPTVAITKIKGADSANMKDKRMPTMSIWKIKYCQQGSHAKIILDYKFNFGFGNYWNFQQLVCNYIMELQVWVHR